MTEQELEFFLCPITRETMTDPVFTSDGQTYEREAIETWLARHDTSPLTNLPLSSKELVPNILARQLLVSMGLPVAPINPGVEAEAEAVPGFDYTPELRSLLGDLVNDPGGNMIPGLIYDDNEYDYEDKYAMRKRLVSVLASGLLTLEEVPAYGNPEDFQNVFEAYMMSKSILYHINVLVDHDVLPPGQGKIYLGLDPGEGFDQRNYELYPAPSTAGLGGIPEWAA